MKNYRFAAQLIAGIFLTALTLALTACHTLYKVPEFNYAGRPIPPSQLLQRVLATYTTGLSTGGASILDGRRDLRGNIQNTKPAFPVAGLSAAMPTPIMNFPEQTHGNILSATTGDILTVNYSTESGKAGAANFGPNPSSVAAAPSGSLFAGASEARGQVYVAVPSGASASTYALNLPNVYRVVVNQGASVILAMVRNSNTLYRVIELPSTSNPVVPPGAVDCQPLLLPQYCVVPVPGTYDRPTNASFSLDGTNVYILNCGPECGGKTASLTVLQQGALVINNVPTVDPLNSSAPSPLANIGVPNPIPIPGGVTVALSSGSTLYVAGQSLDSLGSNGVLGTTPRSDGLFTGYLTTVNLSNYAVSQPISISDGTHTKLLFADDDTLWVGSQQCASGERAAIAQKQLATNGVTTQAGNYNCLTAVSLAGATPTAQIVPAVVQTSGSSAGTAVTVAYPNTNQNLYYYGDLTGLCWVQGYHKVYTAYGGQIHAFFTGGAITDHYEPGYQTTPALGAEADNTNITLQGIVLDVAYIDALTNAAN